MHVFFFSARKLSNLFYLVVILNLLHAENESQPIAGETMAVVPLQPRPATTGNTDVLQLQPRLLPNYERIARESKSEPKDILSVRGLMPDFTGQKIDPELGLASIPAMAIGSSTEVLVSIIENQTGIRRNSFLSVSSGQEDKKSDKDEDVAPRSPASFDEGANIEMTNPPVEVSSPVGDREVILDENESANILDCDQWVPSVEDCDNRYVI